MQPRATWKQTGPLKGLAGLPNAKKYTAGTESFRRQIGQLQPASHGPHGGVGQGGVESATRRDFRDLTKILFGSVGLN